MRIPSLLMVTAFVFANFAAHPGEVAILSNANFEECRKAADAAAHALQTSAAGPIQVFQLEGGAKDQETLNHVKAQSPVVVIAMGSYATRMARKALPECWIVYALVSYPEVEEFTQDTRMVGVAWLGPEKELYDLASSLGHVKKLAVVHSEVIAASVEPMLLRLQAAGFEPTDISLNEAPILHDVMRDVTSRFEAVLLLPDQVTENPSALRFLITSCMEKGLLTLSTAPGFVSQGVLCGTFFPPDACGVQAAVTARHILANGRPPAQRIVVPSGARTALNSGAAAYLHVSPAIKPDVTVE